MTYNRILEAITDKLNNFEYSDLVAMHNIMTDNTNAPDDYIFSMDEFEEVLYGVDKFDLVRMIFNGNFNPNDDHFMFNAYGNLVSIGYAKNYWDALSVEDIASDIENNPDSYSDFFDFDEDEEEEEEEEEEA